MQRLIVRPNLSAIGVCADDRLGHFRAVHHEGVLPGLRRCGALRRASIEGPEGGHSAVLGEVLGAPRGHHQAVPQEVYPDVGRVPGRGSGKVLGRLPGA
eukprot:5019375-Lingulodinium_polyedra.AAC.1